MKKILYFALIICTSVAYGQTTDTIFGRNPDYHYWGWYDECQQYEKDSNKFILRHCCSSATDQDGVNDQMLVVDHYMPGQQTIYGVAVMVSLNPGQDWMASHYLPSVDSLKLPEYVYIYQGGPALPDLPLFYYPRQMTLVDSVRWDTASPRLMALPLNANADTLVYCHVFEAYFDTPVVVADTFYFVGTFRSNDIATIRDTVVVDGVPHTVTDYRFRHFPTDYVVVRDAFTDQCEKCSVVERVFYSPLEIREEWLEAYNWWFMCSGPFLPIVGSAY